MGKIRMNRSRAMAMTRPFDTTIPKAVFLCVLLLSLLVARAALAAGGDPLWSYAPAVAGKQETRASAVDSQGNVILAGYTDAGGNDYSLLKILADGSGLAWPARTFDRAGAQDWATEVAVDSEDDIVVTGYAHSGGSYDIHTIKYSGADGSVLWQHSYNGAAGGNDYANAIALDSLNNIYVGGTSQNVSAEDDFLILKYAPGGPNPDGTPTWAAIYNGPADGHDRLTAIAAGIDGIAATGESQNATPDFDFTVVKYDFDGAKSWEKRYTDAGDGKGMAVALDGAGNVAATGYVFNGSDRDGFTIKYADADGTPIWARTRDRGLADEGRALWLDEAGNVYVAGSSLALATNNDLCLSRYGAADGDDTLPAGWQAIHNTGNGNNDVGVDLVGDAYGDLFVTGITNDNGGGKDDIHTYKYDRSSGTQLWQSVLGSAAYHDRPVGIDLTPAGRPVVGGWSDTAATGYDFVAVTYDGGALDAPTGLSAIVVSTSEIALAWTDNAGNEENFAVERKSGGGDWTVVVANLAADTTGYADTGLNADTRYVYRVKASNGSDGSSPYSNEADARTTLISYDPPAWQHIHAGVDGGDDEPAAIAAGPDNHPVATGFSFSTEGGYDYHTLKLDRGNAAVEQWSARHNDEDNQSDFATAVAIDSGNRVVVSGYASMYGGGAGNTNDVYSLGYPATGGTPNWADQYNGPAGNDDRSAAVATAVDGSDNVAVTGYGKNATPNDDIYLLKYNAAGSRQWAAAPYDGGGLDQPAAVAFDAGGDLFVAGKTWNGGNFDYFVAKYHGSDGTLAWGGAPRIHDGGGDDHATGLAVDGDGNLLVTGYSVGAGGNGDILTLKYDGATGSVLAGWPRVHDGGGYDTGAAVGIDPLNDDVVVAGTTFVGSGNHDIIVIRYPSAGGGALWSKTLDFTGSDEAAVAMAIDRSGVVCVTGASDSGGGDDIVAVLFDHNGLTVGAGVFDGAAHGVDFPEDVVFNAYGEAFVAGVTTNAGNNTDFIVFKAVSAAMQAPHPLSATQLYTQASLAWADNSLNETGFRVERKVDGCLDPGGWTAVTETAANATGLMASGLNPGSTYCFRVQSFNDSGETSRWIETEVATGSPAAPSSLAASAPNTTTASLTWADTTEGESGFTVERCEGSGCDFSTHDRFDRGAGSTSYSDTSVTAGATYRYRVKAYLTGHWVSPYSDIATVSPPAPSAPANLSASRFSETQINLAWSDTTSDEAGFKIERCLGSGCLDFAQIATVGAGVASYANTNLQPNSDYRYRVRATKAATVPWDSPYSAIASATTSVAAPSGLSATTVNSTRVNLSWSDPTLSETGFRLQRCNGAALDCTQDADFTDLDLLLSSNSTGYGDTGVCSDGAYSYRVRAEKSSAPSWQSAWSTTVSAATALPVTPADFAATVVSESEIDLSWTDTLADESGYTLERCPGDETACTTDGDFSPLADIDGSGLNEASLWLKMEEASWGAVVNSAPGGSDGFRSGAVLQADAERGQAGWFDGVNDYLRMTHYGGLNPTAAITVSVWAKSFSATWSDDDMLVSKRNAYILSPIKNGTGLRFSIFYANNISSYQVIQIDSLPVDITVWHQYTGVYDGSFLRLYVDGREVGTPVAWSGTLYNDTGYAYIGRDDGYARYFKGWLDEVLVVPRGLSANEVASLYTLTRKPLVYADAGLQPGASYSYRMRAEKSADCPWQTTWITATAATQSPPAPTGLSADTVNTTRVNLSWTDNSGSETGYRVRRCPGSSCSDFADLGALLAADTQSYQDSSVCEGQTYTYQLRAEKDDGPVWQTTWAGPAEATANAKSAPSALAAARASEVQIDLSWTDADSDETGFAIERCQGDGCSDFAEIATVGSNVVSYQNTALTPGTDYSYRVRSYKTAACGWQSDYSNTASATTTQLSPSNLAASPASTTSIGLNWTDNSGSETGYRLQRCFGAGCGDFADLGALLAANSQSFTDATVCEGQTYGYRVRAEKSDGPIWQTEWVGPAEVTATAKLTPSALSATRASETQINLSWSDANSDETGFKIERCQGASCNDFTEIATAGTTSYQNTGLTPGASYSYRVRATKTAGCGWDSATSATATAITSVQNPDSLVAVVANTTQINLSWADRSSSETAFVIERCEGLSCGDFAPLATVAGNTTSYSDTAVAHGTSYGYRVKAENTGATPWTSGTTNIASAPTPTPTAPGSPTVTAASDSHLDLAWSDATSDETGFTIERCAGSGCGDFAEIATVAANVTTYSDTGLTGSAYRYRVRAFKTATHSWTSGYSAEAEGQLLPRASSGLTATALNSRMIRLDWINNAADEDGTEIEVKIWNGEFIKTATVAPGITTYTDHVGIEENTDYVYRVRPYRGQDLSPYSSEAAITTPPFEPGDATCPQ
ncbi:MAG: hypothetical protein A2X84_02140 [Desulfuromonadaceae bacterium GWC2_58_13]|nr:MAG: hypothetical protein A2X84_02140 [Desulfuromonadaceae bacterium GWC2_58_13]